MAGQPTGDRYIGAAALYALLEFVPRSALLRINAVGNITITLPDGEYWGYIDILTDRVHAEDGRTFTRYDEVIQES